MWSYQKIVMTHGDDTWFSVDNSDTSESYLLFKNENSKYSLDFSGKTKPTQIIIAQSSKVTLKVNGESLDLSQLDKIHLATSH